MKKRGWGRIVNIGSSAGRNRPSSASAHYVSSKAALAGLTRCIAEEGAAHGVTANTLSPGPTITGLTGGSSPEATAARAATIPMGRYANADEIAAVAEFLSSEGASFMTGTVVDVNGDRQMN